MFRLIPVSDPTVRQSGLRHCADGLRFPIASGKLERAHARG